MNAMILAAGLGQRMRPLTDHLPKPLLNAGNKPLLQYHLENLAKAGIRDVIINLAYLGEKIRHFVGTGEQFGVRVSYAEESEPLETAGAILNALPLLGDQPFLLLNGDVWSDFPLAALTTHQLAPDQLAHLVLVPNPEFHPAGDFSPNATGILENNLALNKFTFAGISLMRPAIIRDYPNCRHKFPLGEVLRFNIDKKRISAEIYYGEWSDVGTPERLFQLDKTLAGRQLTTTKI